MLNQAQIAQAWGPACSGLRATLLLHGKGRVTVRASIIEATKALNNCLIAWNYQTRYADTGAFVCRAKVSGNGWSNHSYATAIDINWQKNLYSSRLITDMPRPMVNAICGIRTNNGKQVWNWGGFWSGSKDCVAGDTLVETREGPRPIKDLAGQIVEILSTTQDPASGIIQSQWVKAPIDSYGWDETYTLNFRRRGTKYSVKCNGNHRWPLQRKDKSVELVKTSELLAGMKQGDGFPALQFPELEEFAIDSGYVAQGIVWGDGSIYNAHGSRNPKTSVELCNEKAQLKSWLEPFAGYWDENEYGPVAWKMPAWLKDLPSDYATIDKKASFFLGWFATDGCMKGDVPSLSTSDLEALSWIKENASDLGLTITSIVKQEAGKSGFNSTKDNFTVVFRHIPKNLLIRTDHLDLWEENNKIWFRWNLDSIEKNEGVEEIFCANVEERGVFALSTDSVPILTGNSMHFEIVCRPSDIATGINWDTVPGTSRPQVPQQNNPTAKPAPPIVIPKRRKNMTFVHITDWPDRFSPDMWFYTDGFQARPLSSPGQAQRLWELGLAPEALVVNGAVRPKPVTWGQFNGIQIVPGATHL